VAVTALKIAQRAGQRVTMRMPHAQVWWANYDGVPSRVGDLRSVSPKKPR
jgi:hypothetical protein